MNKKVTSRTKISIAVSVAVGAGLMGAGFAPVALAQQTGDVQRIEVTGTRLPSLSVEGPSPITVINAQDIRFDGVRKTEDLLNNLPQVFADQGGNISNGATGTATVNLRNFGADRTLVLVNGRRLPAGSPLAYAADLNQIPAPLIQRVEVLTGGASAIYGSDAVAGVVNFIMNDKFEGLQIDLNHSFYQHEQGNPVSSIVAARAVGNPSQFVVPGDANDGEINDVSITLGGNFANRRGNATVFFTYKKEEPVSQANRDYSACALGSTAAGFNCAGSSTSFPGRFLGLSANAYDLTVADAAGNTRAFTGNDIYNYGPLNYFRRPSETYGFNAFAHFDVFSDLRMYTELGFHDNRTVAQIAPSGLFGQIQTMRFENPLLSADWRTQMGLLAPGDTSDVFILRRNVEGGGRQDDLRHTSFRVVFGMKGEILKHWNYDVSMHTGKVIYQESYKNDFSIVRAGRSLDVVTDPATGQPACQSRLDGTDPNCVPYDIWRLGGPSAAALAYLQTPGLQKGFTSQQVLGTTFSSDLGNYGIKLPAAKNGVSVAFGVERRIERLEREVDTAFSSGDLFGQGGATPSVSGKVTSGDYFGEMRVPLIEGRQFADLLSVNGSYRTSKYSTRQKADTYGVGLEWAPVKAYRLRGSYQRAVRAANIIELFEPQSIGLYDNDSDPCAGAVPTATLAQCARTGVTAAQYGNILDNPAGQYNELAGGNPDLIPETADTTTFGLVFAPTRNLTGSIDFFNMKVADVVASVPSTITLQQCLDNGSLCNLITRDALGTLWATPAARIVATNNNLATWKTQGIDLALNYNHRMGSYGSLGLNFNGTYLKKFEQEPIKGAGVYDCAGLYGSGTCGQPLPKWRHKVRATWNTPWNIDLALTWRHFDKVLFERTSDSPLLSGPVNAIDRELKAQNYLDIAAAWNLNKTFTLRAGINNLSDQDPPLSAQVGAGFGNGNTYPQVYDALGRLVFVNMTAKF